MGGKNPPRHGTISGYTTMGCRLDCCRRASTIYMKKYRMVSMSGTVKVPSIGAVRRLRALHAIGWTRKQIATEVGMTESGTLFHQEMITRGLHNRIAAVYDRLQATPGPSAASQRYARNKGWAPPLAWDEDTIDDPHAEPNYGAPSHGLDLDEWWFLVRAGESPERAADRCGVTLSAVSGAAYRAGRNELANLAENARKHRRVSA